MGGRGAFGAQTASPAGSRRTALAAENPRRRRSASGAARNAEIAARPRNRPTTAPPARSIDREIRVRHTPRRGPSTAPRSISTMSVRVGRRPAQQLGGQYRAAESAAYDHQGVTHTWSVYASLKILPSGCSILSLTFCRIRGQMATNSRARGNHATQQIQLLLGFRRLSGGARRPDGSQFQPFHLGERHGMAGRRLAGLVLWTLLEYVLHRIALHRMPYFSPMHGEHHAAPLAFIGTPSWISVSVLSLVILLPAVVVAGLQRRRRAHRRRDVRLLVVWRRASRHSSPREQPLPLVFQRPACLAYAASLFAEAAATSASPRTCGTMCSAPPSRVREQGAGRRERATERHQSDAHRRLRVRRICGAGSGIAAAAVREHGIAGGGAASFQECHSAQPGRHQFHHQCGARQFRAEIRARPWALRLRHGVSRRRRALCICARPRIWARNRDLLRPVRWNSTFRRSKESAAA